MNMAYKRISQMFRVSGNEDYIGESISILQHSLQAADIAKKRMDNLNEDDPEFVLAALFHDIGHVAGLEAGLAIGMNGCGIENHETIGSNLAIQLGFSPRIAKLIRSHVNGKRYLCFKDPDYYTRLSEASKTTLMYQGGPMILEEAKLFENDSDFNKILLLRFIDEEAKDPNANPPQLSSYESLINKHSSLSMDSPYLITESQLKFYQMNSYLMIKGLFDSDTIQLNINMTDNISTYNLSEWLNDLSQWPKTDNKWLLHYEIPKQSINQADEISLKKQMCRAENFVNYHEDLRRLCRGVLQSIASQLFTEDAVLFKEKINFKLSGGAGFSAHQDTPAYIGLAKNHLSVYVAVDPATQANGCLEVAPGQWNASSNVPLLPTGVIDPSYESTLSYQNVICEAGTLVYFNGYIPHRSKANISSETRRALIVTYNPLSEGDHHDAYYEAKHSGLQGFASGDALSFQKDFEGVLVD